MSKAPETTPALPEAERTSGASGAALSPRGVAAAGDANANANVAGETAARREKIAQFLRSSAVGIVATIGDMAVLELCLRAFSMSRVWSKIFSLAVGTSIQFFGSRHFAFRAQHGRIQRQLRLFAFVEFLAYWLTVFVFKVLTDWLHLPAELANLACGSIVYFGFSYPLWHMVFRLTPTERAAQGNSATKRDGSS